MQLQLALMDAKFNGLRQRFSATPRMPMHLSGTYGFRGAGRCLVISVATLPGQDAGGSPSGGLPAFLAEIGRLLIDESTSDSSVCNSLQPM
jgi:hypothetical protein